MATRRSFFSTIGAALAGAGAAKPARQNAAVAGVSLKGWATPLPILYGTPPINHVHVVVMDAKSILDHQQEIAEAVNQALQNGAPRLHDTLTNL